VQLAQAAAVLYEHGGLVVDLDTWPARSFEDFYFQMLTDRGRLGHPAALFVSFNGTEVAQQPVVATKKNDPFWLTCLEILAECSPDGIPACAGSAVESKAAVIVQMGTKALSSFPCSCKRKPGLCEAHPRDFWSCVAEKKVEATDPTWALVTEDPDELKGRWSQDNPGHRRLVNGGWQMVVSDPNEEETGKEAWFMPTGRWVGPVPPTCGDGNEPDGDTDGEGTCPYR
jgi:hypothetical protein